MSNSQLRSVEELNARLALCNFFIRVLVNDCADDPRQPDALDHYRAQYKQINAERIQAEKLYRQEHGIPEPEPVVVNLKTARLFAKSEGVK